MKIERFRAEHLYAIELQEAQRTLVATIGDPVYGNALEQSEAAFTGVQDGQVVCCAGIHEVWAGRGVAWALVSCHAGPSMRSIHRAVSGFLAQCNLRRVEMLVDANFAAGHRWAKMLGMQHEGVLRAYGPDGHDYDIYARIRE